MKSPLINLTINDCKIALYPMESVRTAYVNCVIKAGSWYEEGDKWGAFHLMEHMTHQATKQFKSDDEIDIYKEDHGISSNASTGGESMNYWFHCPDNSLTESLDLFNQIVFEPTFPDATLENEKNVINQEYIDKWSNLYVRFDTQILKQLFGEKHIYGRDGIGQPELVKKVTSKQIAKLRSDYFQPKNMCISIAGRIDVDQTIAKLKEILENQKNTFELKKLDHTSSEKPQYLNHIENVDNIIVNLMWRVPGSKILSLKERLTFNIGLYLLINSSSSLIYKKLRKELGLIYSCGSRKFFYPQEAAVGLSFAASPENAQKALDETRKCVQEFIENEIAISDYKRTINYMNMRTLMVYDSVSAIGSDLVSSLFYDDKVYLPEDILEVANTITAKDVQDIFKKYIKADEGFLAVLSKEEIKLA